MFKDLITPITLIVGGALLATLVNNILPEEHKLLNIQNPQEALICGPHVGIQAYVTDYEIDNEYVIDLVHGGIYNVWHCKPLHGEMKPTGNGRDK